MELRGETLIAASRQRVWDALTDPDVLARCIDGVERLDAVGDNRFEGVLAAKVGPVKARFTGNVEMTELAPPERYVLIGEGKGGAAGFAKGSAEVTLTEAEGGTLLAYVARSQVGGKLAQLGTRLIEGTAKTYAQNFFERLKGEVEAPAAPEPDLAAEPAPVESEVAAPEVPAARPAGAPAEPASGGIPGWIWIGALVVLILLVLALLLGNG